MLMIYFSIWLEELKYYLYLILFSLIVAYMIYVVMSAAGIEIISINKISTKKQTLK